MWFHEFFQVNLHLFPFPGNYFYTQNLSNRRMILQFHDFLKFIFGWFLKFGPAVRVCLVTNASTSHITVSLAGKHSKPNVTNPANYVPNINIFDRTKCFFFS